MLSEYSFRYDVKPGTCRNFWCYIIWWICYVIGAHCRGLEFRSVNWFQILLTRVRSSRKYNLKPVTCRYRLWLILLDHVTYTCFSGITEDAHLQLWAICATMICEDDFFESRTYCDHLRHVRAGFLTLIVLTPVDRLCTNSGSNVPTCLINMSIWYENKREVISTWSSYYYKIRINFDVNTLY